MILFFYLWLKKTHIENLSLTLIINVSLSIQVQLTMNTISLNLNAIFTQKKNERKKIRKTKHSKIVDFVDISGFFSRKKNR